MRSIKTSIFIWLLLCINPVGLLAQGLPKLSLDSHHSAEVKTPVTTSSQPVSEQQAQPSIPSNSSMLLNLSLVLGLILAVAGVFEYLRRKGFLQRSWFSAVGPIEVLHRHSISRGTQIMLVRVGGRVLVLGQNSQQLRTLDTICDTREIQHLHHELAGRKPSDPNQAFDQQLQAMQHPDESVEGKAYTLQNKSQANSRAQAVEKHARSILKQRYHGTSVFVLAIGLIAATATAQSANINGESLSVDPDPVVLSMEEPQFSMSETLLDNASLSAPGLQSPQGLSSTLTIILVLTLVSLAPAAIILCTSFTRIIVVLALLRQALGTQTLPPTQVILGLSLFLSLLIMAPTIREIHRDALEPLSNGQITQYEAWENGRMPIREFMFAQIERMGNWDTVYMLMNYQHQDQVNPENLSRDDIDTVVLVPAFVLSELKTAFLMGFRLYLPFLIIDMVVSSILISMGMLMLPPVLISLPFKLLLFVIVDGWMLVAGNLLDSFALPLTTVVT